MSNHRPSLQQSQAVWVAAIIYTLTGSFAKLSLLVVYIRLSPQRSFQYCVAATMALIASYTVGLFFSFLFSCDPMSRSWNALETEGKCINQAALYIATAAANIISDVILFVLPIPLVVKLHMPRMQKIGLFFVFAIGST